MSLKVGVFVDAENVRYNGGYNLRYDILRRFAARGGNPIIRLNAYLAYDAERAKEDPDYQKKAFAYQNSIREFGWKVNIKQAKRYTDETGRITTKANSDLDLAVDAMLQAENLDEILLVTGDGDFLTLVTALQNRGCRVELLGFNNVSRQLTRQVDAYYNGFTIPDLIPVSYEPRNDWGAPGSCVRGYCAKWFPDKGYGFLNYLRDIRENIWVTDHREADSPWNSVFCHVNELADEVPVEDLNNGDVALEFYLQQSEVEDGMVAQNVRPVQLFR